MGPSVHQAKLARTEVVEALASAAAFLDHHPERAALAARARSAADTAAALEIAGREADAAPADVLGVIADAVAVGHAVLADTDAGRKVPRLIRRIEDAAALLQRKGDEAPAGA